MVDNAGISWERTGCFVTEKFKHDKICHNLTAMKPIPSVSVCMARYIITLPNGSGQTKFFYIIEHWSLTQGQHWPIVVGSLIETWLWPGTLTWLTVTDREERNMGHISQTVHELIIQNLRKFICSTFVIAIIRPGHIFAHVTTAVLSWHVQNCDLIWSLFSMQKHTGIANLKDLG